MSCQHFYGRLVNAVIEVVKKETEISSGAFGFFASVQYIIKNVEALVKNILLFGTGKIGRNTCEIW
jgi:glutamyl-tRNA reductase